MKSIRRIAVVAAAIAGLAGVANAQTCTLSSADTARFQAEHLFGGSPTPGPVLVRRAYVAQYDPAHRIPRWTAWTAKSDYRASVDREGRFDSFRIDRAVTNPVRDPDYTGEGFDRGHITPYFISGGDRNGNGVRAAFAPAPSDAFDECTVFEVNYMSNITPQTHNFNGAGGLWFGLETIERNEILPRGVTLHIIAGSIFAPGFDTIGPRNDIGVPDMFYRILVSDQGAVAFLFIHRRRIGSKGCALTARLETCIVTVADIEALTGADFFNALPDSEEQALEQSDGQAVFLALRGGS
jgi:endonuclease G